MAAAGNVTGSAKQDEIERTLRATVAGRPAGTRLPSVRELMRRHRAGPATVEAVLGRLHREGLIDPRPGEGTFVAEVAARPAADHAWQTLALGAHLDPGEPLGAAAERADAAMIDLAAAYPEPALRPTRLLARAAARAAAEPSVWDLGTAAGDPELRSWLARDIGAGFGPEDLLVTAGGQAALTAVFTALGSPGDAVLVESPGYPGALAAARLCGLRPVPVPTDADGVLPDHLHAALSRHGARVAYLQPLLANPSGASLAPGRRRAVVEAVARHGAFLVEDDSMRHLAEPTAAPPLAAEDADGHVVHVRSLTKATAPALRIAGVAARGPVRRRIEAVLLAQQVCVSPLAQEVARRTVTAPGWSRHLAALRRALAERQDVLDEVLAPLPVHAPRAQHGGTLRWLRLHDERDDTTVVATLRRAGVALTAGRPCFAGEAPGAFVRVSVAAASPAAVRRGIALLAAALAAERTDPRRR